MRLIQRLTAVLALAFIAFATVSAPVFAGSPDTPGTSLQIPLWEAVAPSLGDVGLLTNVCPLPQDPSINLTTDTWSNQGSGSTEHLTPWESVNLDVLSMSPTQQTGGMNIFILGGVAGNGCLIADHFRLDDLTYSGNQLWVTQGSNECTPGCNAKNYATHFWNLKDAKGQWYYTDLIWSFEPSTSGGTTVKVTLFDLSGRVIGNKSTDYSGAPYKRRVSILSILTKLKSLESVGSVLVELPNRGQVEIEVYTKNKKKRVRVSAWCLQDNNVPCKGAVDQCGVCNGNGSTCNPPDPSKLVCSPLVRNGNVGDPLTFTATGCSLAPSFYNWISSGSLSPGGSSTGLSYTVSFGSPGFFPVRVRCDGQEATCNANINGDGHHCPLTITKVASGTPLCAPPGGTSLVSFNITVSNPTNGVLVANTNDPQATNCSKTNLSVPANGFTSYSCTGSFPAGTHTNTISVTLAGQTTATSITSPPFTVATCTTTDPCVGLSGVDFDFDQNTQTSTTANILSKLSWVGQGFTGRIDFINSVLTGGFLGGFVNSGQANNSTAPRPAVGQPASLVTAKWAIKKGETECKSNVASVSIPPQQGCINNPDGYDVTEKFRTFYANNRGVKVGATITFRDDGTYKVRLRAKSGTQYWTKDEEGADLDCGQSKTINIGNMFSDGNPRTWNGFFAYGCADCHTNSEFYIEVYKNGELVETIPLPAGH